LVKSCYITRLNVADNYLDSNRPVKEALKSRWQETKSNLKNIRQNKINKMLLGGKRKSKQTGGGVKKKKTKKIFIECASFYLTLPSNSSMEYFP